MCDMRKFTAIIALASALGACGDDFNQAFGYGKSPPDEFSVVTRPPLVIPPDFNLHPPGSADRQIAPQGRDLARLIVLKLSNVAPAPGQALDAAAQALLNKAAQGLVYGDGIREVLANENNGTQSAPAETIETLIKDDAPKVPKVKDGAPTTP